MIYTVSAQSSEQFTTVKKATTDPSREGEWWQSPWRDSFSALRELFQEEWPCGLCSEAAEGGESKRWDRNWSKKPWKEESSTEQRQQRHGNTLQRKETQDWGPLSSGHSGCRGSDLYQLQTHSPLSFHSWGQNQVLSQSAHGKCHPWTTKMILYLSIEILKLLKIDKLSPKLSFH